LILYPLSALLESLAQRPLESFLDLSVLSFDLESEPEGLDPLDPRDLVAPLLGFTFDPVFDRLDLGVGVTDGVFVLLVELPRFVLWFG